MAKKSKNTKNWIDDTPFLEGGGEENDLMLDLPQIPQLKNKYKSKKFKLKEDDFAKHKIKSSKKFNKK